MNWAPMPRLESWTGVKETTGTKYPSCQVAT